MNQTSDIPTTRWSLIDRVVERQPDAPEALAELLNLYIGALKRHLVVRHQIKSDLADDLLQGFICDRVLEKDLVSHADRNKGRFRSLLLTALDRHVASHWRHVMAKKRSTAGHVPLDSPENQANDLAGQHQDPSHAFDLVWARTILERAIERTREECHAGARPDLWTLLKTRVVGPILYQETPTPYAELIAEFGYENPTQATNALTTAKRKLARHIREVIAEYCGNESEIDDELRDLLQILGQG